MLREFGITILTVSIHLDVHCPQSKVTLLPALTGATTAAGLFPPG